jgi:hypothetical protein
MTVSDKLVMPTWFWHQDRWLLFSVHDSWVLISRFILFFYCFFLEVSNVSWQVKHFYPLDSITGFYYTSCKRHFNFLSF